jgi:hypothetical protein
LVYFHIPINRQECLLLGFFLSLYMLMDARKREIATLLKLLSLWTFCQVGLFRCDWLILHARSEYFAKMRVSFKFRLVLVRDRFGVVVILYLF